MVVQRPAPSLLELVLTNQIDLLNGVSQLSARITVLPGTGTLHQLSQVYSDYGYEPKRGDQFPATLPVTVSGSKNRVVYRTPTNVNEPQGLWTRFSYVVTDGTETSEEGIVWVLPRHGRLAASAFHLGREGWSIVRNGASAAVAEGGGIRHEAYSRGAGLNRFVSGTEGEVLAAEGGEDRSRWAFRAPEAFLGNQAGAFGGALAFVMGSSAGDFADISNRLQADARLVTLSCSSCDIGRGVRLAYFAGNASVPLDGRTRDIIIPLQPSAWKMDPRNTVVEWGAVSDCQFVEVLSGLTSIDVLGDHTKRSETVVLDNVRLERGVEVPVACAGVYY